MSPHALRPLHAAVVIAAATVSTLVLCAPGAFAASTEFEKQLEEHWVTRLRPGSKKIMADAIGAVDGVKDGGTGFHTILEDNPWWYVDLGKVHELGRILLYNRESCADRCRKLLVSVSDDAGAWKEVYRHDDSIFHGASDGKPLVIELDRDTRGRYVRVSHTRREYLHLDEVEVFGRSDPQKNLALKRPALQSTASPWSTFAGDVPEVELVANADDVMRALDLTTLTLELVERHEKRPRLKADLARLTARAADAPPRTDWMRLYMDVRRLRRSIILSHPAFAFDSLMINKRPPTGYSHQCDQYLARHSGAGAGLVLLRDWKKDPRESEMLSSRLPVGSTLHPDLANDCSRVAFSFSDHTEKDHGRRRFFIYEADLDPITGACREIRQLTGTGSDPLQGLDGRQTVLIEDFDPCYLPDGSIVFISTRSQNYGRCHGGRYTPAYVMYKMNADGSDLRQFSFGEANEWDPSVLPDGRIIYARWDYINRNDTVYQSLWTMRPDGTGTAHFYGNYTRNPCMTAEPIAIPGSHKVVSTAMAHHGYTAGSLIAIDRLLGEDGEAPLKRMTPEVIFPETEGWPLGSYATPWPLDEDLCLAAYSPDQLAHQGQVQRANAYGIYLVDSLGGRELIYRDPEMSSFAPIPFRPRQTPPEMSSMVAHRRDASEGVFFIQDVHRSTQGIEPGTIKSVRINEIILQPTASVPRRSRADNEIIKRIVGTVPVLDDGSVMFSAPAGKPLQFQALDAEGMAVMTMRSFTYLQPGEFMSCVGCHESRNSTPPSGGVPAAVKAVEIEPPAGPSYEGGFSFARTVQPVLDRHCISCHGGAATEGGIDLTGTLTNDFSAAYDALTNDKMIRLAQRNQETPSSSPGDYFSHASRLPGIIRDKHRDRVKLAPDEWQRLMDWLDLNVQYYGDYSWNRAERQRVTPEGEKAVREYARELFGEAISKQPLATLINVALIDESRILKAPLDKRAGGWGQLAGGWSDTGDSRYRRMRELIRSAITPVEAHDIAGTCGRDHCRCGNCWVRNLLSKLTGVARK